MPLKSGKSNIGKNVGELMHAYKQKGKIGASHPRSKKAAQKQAVAIALTKAKESFDDRVNKILAEVSNLKK